MLVENVSYLRWYKVIDLKIPVYKGKNLYRVYSIDQQNGSVKYAVMPLNEGMYHLKVIAQDWYLLHKINVSSCTVGLNVSLVFVLMKITLKRFILWCLSCTQ